ncbi:MAG: hypothetical protein WCK14_12230 [Actinomycetota bacterium]
MSGSARDWPGVLAVDLVSGDHIGVHVVLSNAGPEPLVAIEWQILVANAG